MEVPLHKPGRYGSLLASALDSGSSGPGSSPGWEHSVVFLGKTLYSHSEANLMLAVALRRTSIPYRRK